MHWMSLARRFFSPVGRFFFASTFSLMVGTTVVAQASNLAVTTFAGTAGTRRATDGTGAAARFYAPSGIAFDRSGNLIVVDAANNIIRKITPAGVVTTLSGTPINLESLPVNTGSADGAANVASFNFGSSSSSDGPWGNPIYTVIGGLTAGLDAAGNFVFADTLNNLVRRVAPDGSVTTIAGTAGASGTDDGAAASAKFVSPGGVAVDASGNVFIADGGNNTIRRLAGGRVSTFAGLARTAGSADGSAAAARFNNPSGVACDAAGNIYVADTGNHLIRKITATGVVSTLAGVAGSSGSSDGLGALARFRSPTALVVDSSGKVYVADTGNHSIRVIDVTGFVSTVAGSSGNSGSADGTGNAARFKEPSGLALDGAGGIYISDTQNNTVRKASVANAASIQIVSQPTRRYVNVGRAASFSVTAAGSGLAYQWRKNGVAIAGATNPTFSIAAAAAADEADYTVVVSSGSTSVTSAVAQLKTYPAAVEIPAVIIITQPTDTTLRSGDTLTLVVEAAADITVKYQWRKNGTDIVGATGSVLSIANTTPADSGSYTVVVSDGGMVVPSSAASVAVQSGAGAPTITTQPVPQSVNAGAAVSFSVSASGTRAPAYQWFRNGLVVSGATAATLSLANVSASDAGSYYVVITDSGYTVTSASATLVVNVPANSPSITAQPQAQAVAAGASVTLSVTAAGTAPLTYQWYKDGTPVAGQTSATYSIAAVAVAQAGSYTVVVTGPGGSVTSSAAALTVSSAPAPTTGRLINLSINTSISAGGNFTMGYVVGGAAGTRSLLVRAIGPGLAAFGVPGTLSDPKLELYTGSTLSGGNDNWGGGASLANAFASVGAFSLDPASLDAATQINVVNPSPANTTVIVSGAKTSAGLVLAEIYDLATTYNGSSPRLVNVSVNKNITAGETLIAGFVIDGGTGCKVLVRAVGPGLAAFGVPGTMADPKLVLYSGSNKIGENDNWGGDAQVSAAATQVGAFGLGSGSKDAVLLVSLPPGAYTAQVSGTGGGGIALVEVYEVP